MCNRYSWIEAGKDGVVWFLTGEDIYNTSYGKELQQYSQREEDYIGHGAIHLYYGLPFIPGLKNHEKECSDFSTPDNFPDEIVSAIKSGKMRKLGFDKNLLEMLSKRALKSMSEIIEARDAYIEAENTYIKARRVFIKASEACDEASEASEASEVYAKAYEAYIEANKNCDKADKNYDKAVEVYNKACKAHNDNFWDIFAIKNNRKKCWR